MISLSSCIQKVVPSATLAISAQANRMKAEGISIISFGAGEPDFKTPSLIKEAAMRAISENFTKYTAVSGFFELKEKICKKFKQDNHLDYTPSEIVVSCGAKHSLFNAIQVLCERNDEVIIFAPYWVSYPEMVRLAGATPVVVQTKEENGFKVSAEQLKKALTLRTKMIIFNSPSNPTGMLYTKADFEDLADILFQTDAIIMSDEIYEHITYEKEHVSLFQVLPELKSRGILVNGHSKAYSMTGWRIGYMAASQEICQAVSSYQSHSTSNPCSISQKAALAGLEIPKSFFKDHANLFRQRRDVFIDRVKKIDGVSCLCPEGAFYLFVNVQDFWKGSGVDLSHQLLKNAHIAVVPGEAFGKKGYIRFSYALDLDSICEGISRFEKWIQKNS